MSGILIFYKFFWVYKYPDLWDPVLVSKKTFCSCHASTEKWVLLVKFAVNLLQIYDLRELQLTCGKMVDFRLEHKVVPFDKFRPNYRSFMLTTPVFMALFHLFCSHLLHTLRLQNLILCVRMFYSIQASNY
jgi:hypothetical protein